MFRIINISGWIITIFILTDAIISFAESSPPCKLLCNVESEWKDMNKEHLYRYDIDITCEPGSYNEKIERSDDTQGKWDEFLREFKTKIIKSHFDGNRTYINSGRTYNIIGDIKIEKDDNKVSYRIVVNGGVFGEKQQICEK